MCDDDQAASEAETVPGARGGSLVRQVLGNLLQAAPHQPVEWLQKERGLADAIEQLPRWIPPGQVGIRLLQQLGPDPLPDEVLGQVQPVKPEASRTRTMRENDPCLTN